MSSLYRCQARVAYKPLGSDKLIVFDERQISSISTTLVVNASDYLLNNRGKTDSIYSLEGNTCSVVLNDPFLDGVSWQTLSDVDGLSSITNLAANEGQLLPKCSEGQDPAKDKCSRYGIIDSDKIKGLEFPFIIITLWYEVGDGVQSSKLDLYFKVTSTSISHGTSGEPTVTIGGRGIYEMKFRKNITQYFLEKDQNLIDELNKKALNASGYEAVDICSGVKEGITVAKTSRISSISTEELLAKQVGSIDGAQILSLPTKAFVNKIEICTKPDTACYTSRVFYLGKGLYEKYQIKSEVPTSDVDLNYRRGGASASQPVVPKTKNKQEYESQVPDPKTTKEKLDKVNTEAFSAFEKQFDTPEDYLTGYSTNGWKGSGGNRKFTIEKVEKTALFGDAKGSGEATAYLGGTVVKIDKASKAVMVRSDYYIQYCLEGKCYRGDVFQEYMKLGSISSVIKEGELLAPGRSVGETDVSDPQKKSKFRYFLKADGGDIITLDPTSIKSLVSVKTALSEKDKQDSAPDDGQSGELIGKIGLTGRTDGPHLHAEWVPSRPISKVDVDKYVRFAGGGPAQGSPYGTRQSGFHSGTDITAELGTPLYTKGGAKVINADRGISDPGGYGWSVLISTPEGNMVLGHLQENSIPGSIPEYSGGTGERSTSSSTPPQLPGGDRAAAPSKNGINLTTEFKGVPKALEILPGRTVLSFITDYDDWIRSGKSRDVDPNVWIPDAYRTWFISKTDFEWDRGDLRVKVEGFRPWRTKLPALEAVPKWEAYRADKGYVDYYDYIRATGDLCYKMLDGKSSCAVCKAPSEGDTGTGPGGTPDSVAGGFAEGPCQYTGTKYSSKTGTINSLLNASQSGLGIKNKYGLAGIVGNSGWESAGWDPKARGGRGERGLFQWNPAAGRLQELEAYAKNRGLDPFTVEAQVQFFVYEVKNRGYSSLIPALNGATSVEDAVAKFERIYEKAGIPALAGRNEIAKEIYSNLSCQ